TSDRLVSDRRPRSSRHAQCRREQACAGGHRTIIVAGAALGEMRTRSRPITFASITACETGVLDTDLGRQWLLPLWLVSTLPTKCRDGRAPSARWCLSPRFPPGPSTRSGTLSVSSNRPD